MEELKKILFSLNEIQYLNPITHYADVEGLGERGFTTTKEIESDSRIDEGIIEIHAVYGDTANPTATLILEVNVLTREVSNSMLYQTNPYLIKEEVQGFELPAYI